MPHAEATELAWNAPDKTIVPGHHCAMLALVTWDDLGDAGTSVHDVTPVDDKWAMACVD